MIEIKLSEVCVGERARKDLGDIDALAESIEEIGLLQPIGITVDHDLVFGERRLRAFEHLGRIVIPARVVDVPSMLQAEHAENEIRKDFTASERVAIGRAIEAEIGDRRRFNADGGPRAIPQNFAESKGKETRKEAAERAGFGNAETYRQAKTVVDDAEPELVDAMDRGEVAISTAAKLTRADEATQREAAAEPKRATVLASLFTGDENWYTPPEYLESARAVMGGIDLDPASCVFAQGAVRAGGYYTAEDDGLEQDWRGRVWLNPPYTARVINRFVSKLCAHVEAGDVPQAVLLTNSNTDTSWFHQAAQVASAVCFTAGRISFMKEDGARSSPTNGQSFFYFGDNAVAFKWEFAAHGLVMVRA